jgi:hypothetical protein
MKQHFFLGLLAIMAAPGNSLTAQIKEAYPTGIAHVVVIGVDGLSPDGIRKAATPVMHHLIDNGAVKWNVRTVLPSSSSPNWASMIMGAGVEQHGVLDNDWEREEHSLPAIARGEEGIFPTIFGVIRKEKPGAEIGAAYHWDGFGRLFEKKAMNYDQHFPTETATTENFVQYLIHKKPTFAFLHLDHVDHAGHAYGHGSPEYYQSVAVADSLMGAVLEGIKKAGMDKNTLVIITADHGGVGYGHGGATIGEAEIAMILYGKGVKKGYAVQQQVVTYDLAATIAFALKIVPPYVWTGRPIKSAFVGFKEPANLWLGKSLIPSPIIYPDRLLYEQAGGLYIDQPAEVKMSAATGNTIRYTLDGAAPNAQSAIYTQPFVLETNAIVKATSFDKNGNESMPAVAYFRILKSGNENGLKVRYYKGDAWKYLPDFRSLTPAQQWESPEFKLNREQILPLITGEMGTFGAILEGFININTPGKYTFFTQSDDGSKLFINDKEVVNNDGDHGVLERAGSVQLEKGRQAIRVEYFNGHGGFWLDCFYKGPGIPKQIIPANQLFLKK